MQRLNWQPTHFEPRIIFKAASYSFMAQQFSNLKNSNLFQRLVKARLTPAATLILAQGGWTRKGSLGKWQDKNGMKRKVCLILTPTSEHLKCLKFLPKTSQLTKESRQSSNISKVEARQKLKRSWSEWKWLHQWHSRSSFKNQSLTIRNSRKSSKLLSSRQWKSWMYSTKAKPGTLVKRASCSCHAISVYRVNKATAIMFRPWRRIR